MKNQQKRTAIVKSTLLRYANVGTFWHLKQQVIQTPPKAIIYLALEFFSNKLTSPFSSPPNTSATNNDVSQFIDILLCGRPCAKCSKCMISLKCHSGSVR